MFLFNFLLCGAVAAAAAAAVGFELMMMTNDVFLRFGASSLRPRYMFPLKFKMFGQVNFPSHAVSQLISFLN